MKINCVKVFKRITIPTQKLNINMTITEFKNNGDFKQR